MNKKIGIYHLIYIWLILTGCNGSGYKSIETDTNHDALKGKVLPMPILSERPIAIYYCQFGIIIVPGFQDGVIQLIDTTSGKVITSQYTRGKAPGELLDPIGMDYNPENSTFCIWDLGKQSFNLYKVTPQNFDLYSTTSYSGINPSIIRNLNDSIDIILSSIPDQSIIIHGKGGIIKSIPYQILNEPGLDYFDNYYPSEIDVNPKSSLIFTADPYLPYIAAYSCLDNKIVKLWDKMVFQPKYTIKKRWRYILEDSYLGFDCISVSDKYIYLTYYGITRSQWEKEVHKRLKTTQLMIFDFDGNLVKHLILDHNLEYITVSPDDRVLYGIMERPDWFIVKYQLEI